MTRVNFYPRSSNVGSPWPILLQGIPSLPQHSFVPLAGASCCDIELGVPLSQPFATTRPLPNLTSEASVCRINSFLKLGAMRTGSLQSAVFRSVKASSGTVVHFMMSGTQDLVCQGVCPGSRVGNEPAVITNQSQECSDLLLPDWLGPILYCFHFVELGVSLHSSHNIPEVFSFSPPDHEFNGAHCEPSSPTQLPLSRGVSPSLDCGQQHRPNTQLHTRHADVITCP